MRDEEDLLREKLQKIETLFAGAKTPGERAAADAARQRIRTRLEQVLKRETPLEMKFTIFDPWSRMLFIALSRRYGLEPYRYRRMRRQTLYLKAPKTFLNDFFWPEFQQLDNALHDYVLAITEKVIREEVHADLREVEERPHSALPQR